MTPARLALSTAVGPPPWTTTAVFLAPRMVLLFGSRIRDSPGRFHRNAPKRSARGDVKGFPIAASEGDVGHLIHGNRNEFQELTLWRQNIDASLELFRGLVRRVWFVQSAGDVESALEIHLQPIGTAPVYPVEDHRAALDVYRAVGAQAKSQEFPGAAHIVVVVVGDVQKFVPG